MFKIPNKVCYKFMLSIKSTLSISEVKREIILPKGVMSKKNKGARKTTFRRP